MPNTFGEVADSRLNRGIHLNRAFEFGGACACPGTGLHLRTGQRMTPPAGFDQVHHARRLRGHVPFRNRLPDEYADLVAESGRDRFEILRRSCRHTLQYRIKPWPNNLGSHRLDTNGWLCRQHQRPNRRRRNTFASRTIHSQFDFRVGLYIRYPHLADA